MGDYDSIINHSPPFPENRVPMDLQSRAAQFSPFAALTGFDDMITESGRLTDEEIFIIEDKASFINDTIRVISENLSRHPLVDVTYFVPDKTKAGGKYVTVQKRIVKYSPDSGELIAEDATRIETACIKDISLCGREITADRRS